MQGFYEELVFRGFFMISIIRKNTIFVAVMVNSILFGLTHGFNNGFQVLALLNLILFGIFESIYLLKTGNIWALVQYIACGILYKEIFMVLMYREWHNHKAYLYLKSAIVKYLVEEHSDWKEVYLQL